MTMVEITALDPDSRDAGAVAHYGDPVREQRLLADAVGISNA
jgi:tRNA-modifying protein YgfZ